MRSLAVITENPSPEADPGKTKKRLGEPLLSSRSREVLEAELVRAGGTASQARAAAKRVFTMVYARDRGQRPSPVDWTTAGFASLGIGAWAHPTLLALDLSLSLQLEADVVAEDGTHRLVLRANDGSLLETVIIPGPARTTVCISSQVGCARACTFCETGAHGLGRQLDAGEIVDQVRIARSIWQRTPGIDNVVFMGMGEPFDNLDQVSIATRLLSDDLGLALARSRITISTVGVADKLGTFFETARAELAVSLNAPDDERRSRIMPINDRFDMARLKQSILAALPRGKKVLFEYVLIRDFNDSIGDANILAAYVRDVPSRVNVIPVNPGPNPAHQPPEPAAVDAFVARLAELGVVTLVRRPRGRDVGGACGQLAGALRYNQSARTGEHSSSR